MIKLRFGQFFENNWNFPMCTEEFQHAVAQYGIAVVRDGEDVFFQDVYYCAGQPIDRPTIIYDRHDTSRVTPTALAFEDNSHVLGFVIPLRSTDPSRSLAITQYGNGKDYPLPKKPVGVVTTMLWHRCVHHWSRQVTIPKKTIRASFCGTVDYPVDFTKSHRKDMMNNWPQEGTFAVFQGTRNYEGNEEEYFEIAKRSKVVVSPWGVCEVSVRDYEAALAGCMIVKPKQPAMELYCNPWMTFNTVYCEPDFRDLPYAIKEAEERYDPDALRELAVHLLDQGTDINNFACYFAETIRRIMACCT